MKTFILILAIIILVYLYILFKKKKNQIITTTTTTTTPTTTTTTTITDLSVRLYWGLEITNVCNEDESQYYYTDTNIFSTATQLYANSDKTILADAYYYKPIGSNVYRYWDGLEFTISGTC